MIGTSPRFLRLALLAITMLSALSCSSMPEDIRALLKEAESGNPEAQYNLGFAYSEGKVVKQDYGKAAKWYQKAAEKGNAKAQAALGNACRYGQGVQEDKKEAVKWYRKAAEQNDAGGLFSIGVAYLNGDGVLEDHMEGMKWLEKAAEQGSPAALRTLAFMYGKDKVVRDDMRAYFWASLYFYRGPEGENWSEIRDIKNEAEKNLSRVQLMEVQNMTQEWDAKHPRK